MSDRETSRKPETIPVPLILHAGFFEDVLKDAQKLNAKRREAFMSSGAEDPKLPQKAKAWAKAGKQVILAAGCLFNQYPADADRQQRALAILNECKQESFLREANLMQQYELAEEAGQDSPEELDKKMDAVLDAIHFCARAQNTHISWVRRFMKSETYESAEFRYEKQVSKEAFDTIMRVPEGHAFYPAHVFPSGRVPKGDRVPYPPLVYAKWKNLPLEDFIFDEEHDDFVLPEGYVSEDGRIDDQSVVFDRAGDTVTMRFVGEEPVTWNYWRPKNDRDTMDYSSWCAEYERRLYKQFIIDSEFY